MTTSQDSKFPSVSIIFLTYNGMPLVEDVLKMIRGQDFSAPIEIVCIDSTSKDGTFEVCKQYCDQHIQIRQEEFHHSRTRNLGVSMSTNEICVFLSQDALPAETDWLARLIEPFLDHEVGAVYGKQEAPESFGPQRRYSLAEVYPPMRQVRKFDAGMPRTLQQIRFSNANGAVRRELLQKFPFPEFVLISEDVAACYRIQEQGYSVVYEPAARVIHGHERSVGEEFRWAFDSGVSLKRLGILGNPNFGSETKYGLQKMAAEMLFFAKRGAIGTVALSFTIYMARWLGVQLGKREKILPKGLVRLMSPTLEREYRTASFSELQHT